LNLSPPNNNHLISGSLIRGILKLALPMFASALFQNIQNLIDLFWVGRMGGSSSVAALALSGTILMMVFPVIMGMATATVALVSRRIGEGRAGEASETAAQSLMMASVLGLAVGCAGSFAAVQICRMLGSSEEVTELASSYLRISFLGSFTIFTLFIGNSVLQAAGNTVIPMCAMIMANLINIVLDPILIFGLFGFPKLGIRGAALATVLAQACAAALVLRLISKGVAGIRPNRSAWRLSGKLAMRIAQVGLPSMGQMLSRSLMALVLMRIVASSGTAAIAAYGIGLRFHMITLMPAFALANAAATMVGQNMGAGNTARARTAAWLAAGIDVGLMSVAAAAMFALAPVLVGFFDSSELVVETGTAYLRVVSPFYVFVALAIVLGRSMNGAGHTLATMVFTIISLWGIQVPLAVFLSGRFDPATHGVWWAMAFAITAHGLLVTGWFLTGRWQRHSSAVQV